MNKQQIKSLLESPGKKAFNFGLVQSGNVDLMIYGGIGFELDVDALVSELKGIDAQQITVYINSVGGYAYDGIAIYNALRNHPANIVTNIEGLAASAASVIAMAGDEVQIGKTAFLMIHNPMSIVMGESKDMRKEADALDKLQGGLAQAYANKSGRPVGDFIPMMNEETWFSADEAKAAGLVDTITDDETEPAVTEDALNVYNHVPDRLRAVARATKTKPPSGPNGKTASRDAAGAAATKGGPVNLDEFKAFATANPDAAKPFVEQGKTAGATDALNAERARAKAVAEACGDNHSLAIDLILGGHEAGAADVAAKAAAKAKAGAEQTVQASAQALTAAQVELVKANEKIAFLEGKQGAVSSRRTPASTTAAGGATDTAESVTAKAKEDWAKNADECQSAYADEGIYVHARLREAGVKPSPTKK